MFHHVLHNFKKDPAAICANQKWTNKLVSDSNNKILAARYHEHTIKKVHVHYTQSPSAFLPNQATFFTKKSFKTAERKPRHWRSFFNGAVVATVSKPARRETDQSTEGVAICTGRSSLWMGFQVDGSWATCHLSGARLVGSAGFLINRFEESDGLTWRKLKWRCWRFLKSGAEDLK